MQDKVFRVQPTTYWTSRKRRYLHFIKFVKMASENSALNAKMDGLSIKTSQKRENYIDVQEYFMAVAFLSAKRSKDPRTQVGACIVNDENKIVGIGYNGMPNGCSDDEFPWTKESDDLLERKTFYVCHAELNAVLNKNSSSVKNCTMYVALFPCNECAKVIIQSGIKLVVYVSDKQANKNESKAAKRMFNAAGVAYRQYLPKNKRLIIDFTEIDETKKDDVCRYYWIFVESKCCILLFTLKVELGTDGKKEYFFLFVIFTGLIILSFNINHIMLWKINKTMYRK